MGRRVKRGRNSPFVAGYITGENQDEQNGEGSLDCIRETNPLRWGNAELLWWVSELLATVLNGSGALFAAVRNRGA